MSERSPEAVSMTSISRAAVSSSLREIATNRSDSGAARVPMPIVRAPMRTATTTIATTAAARRTRRIRWGQYGRRMDDLVVLSRDPLNAETPLARQVGSITPVAQHYVRSHFAAPAAPGSIAFDGRVEAPFSIAAEELRSLPARSLIVTLECAG